MERGEQPLINPDRYVVPYLLVMLEPVSILVLARDLFIHCCTNVLFRIYFHSYLMAYHLRVRLADMNTSVLAGVQVEKY